MSSHILWQTWSSTARGLCPAEICCRMIQMTKCDELLYTKQWSENTMSSFTPMQLFIETLHFWNWGFSKEVLVLYICIYIHKLQVSQCTQKFIYLTYYVRKQAQRTRTRCWLEWAPNSVSTISMVSITYSTPVPLVRAGQGVSWNFAYPFSFLVPLAQLKHHPEITLKQCMWLLDLSDQKLPTLFSWPQVMPGPLLCLSTLVPTSPFLFTSYTSHPSGPIPSYSF